MDNEMIKRCAIAAMIEIATAAKDGSLIDRDDELFVINNMDDDTKNIVVDLFSAFLDRIDAERGKDAVAEVSAEKGLTYGNRPTLPPGTKLFLYPTIPEGWELVPEKTTHAMHLAGEVQWENSGNPAPDPSAIYRAMLAAAKGERNAD